MQYSVIVEKNDGIWRAFIPALADLSAEGASEEEAVNNARQSAEKYLASVKIRTIEINQSEEPLRWGSPQAFLQAAGLFVGDEEAMLEHIEEIYAERRRQRDEAEREIAHTEAHGKADGGTEIPTNEESVA